MARRTIEERRAEITEFVAESLPGADSIARTSMLLELIDEYLGRWRQFYSIPEWSLRSVLHSDLHVVLSAGVDVADPVVESLVGAELLKEKWRHFAALVRAVNEHSDPSIDREMAARLSEARAEFSREQNGPG